MTVKKLRSWPTPMDNRPAKTPLPRCDHDVQYTTQHDREWRETRGREGEYKRYADGRPMQCTRDAVVVVDGTPYCRRHGGQIVLDQYLAGELVKKRKRKACS